MQVVVTGGTGFLGSRIVRFLAFENSISQVLVVTRQPALLRQAHAHNPGVTYISREAAFKSISDGRVRGVIHAATEYGRTAGISEVVDANLILPITLLEACANKTGTVFLNVDSFFNKDKSRYTPLANYSLSKRALCHWMEFYSDAVLALNVSLEHVYGTQDDPKKFVPQMIDRIARRKSALVPLTHGQQIRDFIYVDDAARAICRIFSEFALPPLVPKRSRTGIDHFEVGTGVGTTIAAFAQLVKDLSGSPTELGLGILPAPKDEIPTSVADLSHLYNLGWTPEISLREGIQKCVEKVI